MLLGLLPESAPYLAELAVNAYDISDHVPKPPKRRPDRPLLTVVPKEPKSIVQVAMEYVPTEAERAADEQLARSMCLDLGPYRVIAEAFVHPILLRCVHRGCAHGR